MLNKNESKKPLMSLVASAGSSFPGWIKLLQANKYKVDVKYIPKALLVTIITFVLSPFFYLERFLYDKKIKTQKVKNPVFIIGHMRSGTTFLHLLMSKDDQFTFASTTEAIFPGTFLTLRIFLVPLMRFIMPKKRPMDNMKLSEDAPQEEEFAIANLCLYSPYNGAYFPKNIKDFYYKYSLFLGTDETHLIKWKKTYKYYLQKLSYKSNGKRILSKSLVNAGRIQQLLEIFPDAKFIFISRNPYEVFLSTKKLYQRFILNNMSYQAINDEALENHILDFAEKGFVKYFESRYLLSCFNLYEIKYEDLIKNPVECMESIYIKLGLRNFCEVKDNIAEFCKSYSSYMPDKYNLPEELKERIYNKLKFVFDEYHYKK